MAEPTASGRKYLTKGRPKGNAPWNPTAKLLALLKIVKAVLANYQFAITARQVFYRLVGLGVLDKNERAYSRLLYLLGRARRAGMIGWDEIADESLRRFGPTIHAGGPTDFFEWARERAKSHLFVDWSEGLACYPIIWTESAGMASSLRGALASLHWPVMVVTTSGTDSAKAKHDMAEEAIERYRKTGQVTKIGHIGDLDEAGLSILDALSADMKAFADDAGCPGAIEVVWLALTPAQVAKHKLPTAPGKKAKLNADGRLWTPPGGTMAESVQAEALDPTDLTNIVLRWLLSVVDVDALNVHLQRSGERKDRVDAYLEATIDEWVDEDDD